MTSWWMKAFAQRAVGALPRPHFWNELLQKHATGSLVLTDDFFVERLGVASKHLDHYELYAGRKDRPPSVLEIGTGWFPVVPIALWLCGCDRVRTFDITRHLSPARLATTLAAFSAAAEHDALREHLPRLRPERLAELRQLSNRHGHSVDRQLPPGVTYHVGALEDIPADRGFADLIVSYSVFLHLPPERLEHTLATLWRAARPGSAVMSHWIDMSDLNAYFDPSISRLNFLRFSDRLWALISNPIAPVNRLRPSDFRRLLDAAGFAIVGEETIQAPMAEIAHVPLATCFRRYGLDDLLTLDAWFVCKPALRAH